MTAAKDSVTRRLAAILIADVVGYTRLMERDDTGTFSRLRNMRDEVVDPAIVSHGGRIVKTAGDGLLAEFPSALAALRTSVQIQQEMAKRNEGSAAGDRIDYRIGVNLGDIMVDGSDIAGDGVNVASRLEALAEPGEICVSASVREQVHGQMPVSFQDIGEQRVKNIERPIRAFRVVLGGASPRRRRAAKPNGRSLALGVCALLVVLALAVGGWWLYGKTNVARGAAPPMSIAVLPISVTGQDVAAPTLASRMTQDVISALARGKRSARVSAYALVSEYRGNEIDPRAVGRALNVRYVAEADIRLAAGTATVLTRLYDARTAEQLATDTSQVTETDASARDDQVVTRVALQITAALRTAERIRARNGPIDTDLDLVARTSVVLQAGNYSVPAMHEAIKLVDDVLKRDPANVSALVRRFWLLNNLYEEDLHVDRDWVVREMDRAKSQAVLFDVRDAEAWHARAIAFGWQGRFAEAEQALAEARRLDPGDPEYLEQRTHLLFITGQLDPIRPIVEEVARRTGSYSDREMRDLCWLNVAGGDHTAAIPFCAKAAALSDWWADDMYLAAAYAQAGRIDDAKAAAGRVVKAQPDITIDLLRKRRYSSHPDYRRWEENQLFAGLRKAGIPEK